MSKIEGDTDLAFVCANFGRLWPTHLSGFTRLLMQLRKSFDGDLDLLLVLALIAERTRPQAWSRELRDHGRLTRGRTGEVVQTPINIQSIADFSGMPRETVRRKVLVLQEKDWVERDTKGLLTISPRAGAELTAATRGSVAYLAELLRAFRGLGAVP